MQDYRCSEPRSTKNAPRLARTGRFLSTEGRNLRHRRWRYEARRMGKRHPNPRLVKLHRSYTVEQIARLFDIHKNTVRAWVKQGLQPIDGLRPALFHGPVLVAFLQRRRESAKQPCLPGHIYCLPCRAPKAPAGNMAEFVPVTDTTGNLRGICPDCDRSPAG